MMNTFFAAASFLIAACAFALGAIKLFRKKKPLYLQLLVCAAGCFAIEQLSSLVNIWCQVDAAVSIGMIGIFGCNFFLLSANYGTLDKIVDDGRGSKRARAIAIAAPVITAALAACAFLLWLVQDTFCAVMWLIVLLPALPASYFNLKHILLPLDPFEFLRATKPCNICALFFYVITAATVICSSFGLEIAAGAMSVAMSLSVLALTVSAIKGASKWGI